MQLRMIGVGRGWAEWMGGMSPFDHMPEFFEYAGYAHFGLLGGYYVIETTRDESGWVCIMHHTGFV